MRPRASWEIVHNRVDDQSVDNVIVSSNALPSGGFLQQIPAGVWKTEYGGGICPQCESRLQRVVDQQQTLPCKETGLDKRMKRYHYRHMWEANGRSRGKPKRVGDRQKQGRMTTVRIPTGVWETRYSSHAFVNDNICSKRMEKQYPFEPILMSTRRIYFMKIDIDH